MDAITPPKPKVLVEGQPFIPYVKEEDFDPRLKPVVEPYKKRMGFLPNALKLYAHRPEIAETLWSLNSKIMRDPTSTLDQLLKRKLAAVACATNGCAYCTAHSCSMLKKPTQAGFEGWGLSEQELQDIITGDNEPANEMEQRLLRLRALGVGGSDLGAGRNPAAAEEAPDAAADRRARLRGRLLEVLQHGARQPAHPGRVPAPRRHRLCQPLACVRRAGARPASGAARRRRQALMSCLRRCRARRCWRAARTGASARWSAICSPSRRGWRSCASISARRHGHHRAAIQPDRSRSRICRASNGVSVGAVAQALHVSSAFVASETGKLARRGFLLKRTNPLDRRGVLLSIAPAGRLKLDRISAEIRAINDLFFGALDAKAFAALSGVAAALVESSGKAMRVCTTSGIAATGVAGHGLKGQSRCRESRRAAAICRTKWPCGNRAVSSRTSV